MHRGQSRHAVFHNIDLLAVRSETGLLKMLLGSYLTYINLQISDREKYFPKAESKQDQDKEERHKSHAEKSTVYISNILVSNFSIAVVSVLGVATSLGRI